MPVHKITVSLSEDAYEHAVHSAQDAGVSLSAWLSTAADHMAHLQDGLRAVAEFEARFGAFTEDELAITKAELDALGVGRPASAERTALAEEALRRLRAGELEHGLEHGYVERGAA